MNAAIATSIVSQQYARQRGAIRIRYPDISREQLKDKLKQAACARERSSERRAAAAMERHRSQSVSSGTGSTWSEPDIGGLMYSRHLRYQQQQPRQPQQQDNNNMKQLVDQFEPIIKNSLLLSGGLAKMKLPEMATKADNERKKQAEKNDMLKLPLIDTKY